MPDNETTFQRRGRPTTVGQGKPSRTGRALTLPLTPKQEAFILAWMVRRNATRAYQDAYPGACYSTASAEGSRLFRDHRISQKIQQLLAEERTRITSNAHKVTDTLAAIAFSSLADVLDDQGNVIPLTNLPRDVGQAVKKVKRREIIRRDPSNGERKVIGHTIEVEMHDKVQPLRLLGLADGMFNAKVEYASDDALLAALRKGRERALRG